MELEFDKEIDALLRDKAPLLTKDGRREAGAVLSPHLDADEISVFSENAMPEATRTLYAAHFAECDRCRKILSDLILLRSEAEPESAFVATPAVQEAAIPWHRRLFLFPDLAYVMGGLVLLFSGFLGYTALQNSDVVGSSDVSRVSEAPSSASGPNLGQEQPFASAESFNTNAANSSANVITAQTENNPSANTTTNSSANPIGQTSAADSGDVSAGAPIVNEGERRKDEDKNLTIDGVSAAAPMTAPPPAKEQPKATEKDDALAKSRQENKLAAAPEESRSNRGADMKVMRDLPQTARGPAKSKSGPSREQQMQFPNRTGNIYEVAITREVGGRTFERNGAVWYDTAYRGQGTTNIRRGTDAYKKLDSGLRSIADTLAGTVVVVWAGKAYRIQ